VNATYSGGSGTSSLVFQYTILSGQNDTNGISINANSLRLNGGTIKASSGGNDAVLTHNGVSNNPNYLVDTTPPIASITVDSVTADNVLNIPESSADVIVTGRVVGEVEVGATVTISLSDGSSTYTYTGQVTLLNGLKSYSIAVDGSKLASDSNKTLEASVPTIDAAGNEGTATASHLYTLNTIRPAITEIIPDWGTVLDAQEMSAASAVTITTSGVDNGLPATITLDGKTYGSIVFCANACRAFLLIENVAWLPNTMLP